MIQRIQSVYLLLAALVGLIMFVVPIGADANGAPVYITTSVPAIALLAVSCLDCLITIALFRNRKVQITICKTIIIVFAAVMGTAFYTCPGFATMKPGLFIPFLSIILVVLAHNAIRKDEKLVRSADRLR